MSSDLHESLLKDTLAKAPKLTGLHVINCYKLHHDAVLDIAAGVPALRELSYSTWVRLSCHPRPNNNNNTIPKTRLYPY
jgi:hypothetical protein